MKITPTGKQDNTEKWRKEASKTLSSQLDDEDGGISNFQHVEQIQCVRSVDK
jgi:hypothetical protein